MEAPARDVGGPDELHTVQFLRTEGLDALVKKFGLNATRHNDHPNLVLLKYDQVDSPFAAAEVQECRGLILDEDHGWLPVAMPFVKFFNHGESNGADLDWSKPVRVTDKVDGSLSTLYWYKGDWHVSSSGRPDGAGAVYRTSVSDPKRKLFRELFWQTWASMGYAPLEEEHRQYCFMFELFSVENRIIVSPQEELLLLTGARDMSTLQEKDPGVLADRFGWRTPQVFTEFSSIEEVRNAARSLNPHLREGFVVCDHRFQRVKIKSPTYVALAHLTRKDKNGLNKRRMLDIVRTNEGSEFLAYFPQWAPLHGQVKERYDELCDRAELAWATVSELGAGSKRAFAEACRLHGGSGVTEYLHARSQGRAGSARVFYGAMKQRKLEQFIPRWNGITDTTPVIGGDQPLVEAITEDEQATS